MKIGLVIDDGIDSNDGVQQYVKTLGKWFQQSGHEVMYITSTGKADHAPTYSVSRNIKVRFNKNVLRVPLSASARQLRAILQKEDFDLIHIQMPYSPLLGGRLIHVLPESVALVGTFHIAPFGGMQASFSKILGYVLKPQIIRFQSIVSVSPAASDFAKKAFGIKSIVIPNAVNAKAYGKNSKKKANRIVFVGRLVHRKGCLQLLIGINHLVHNNQYTDFELVIIGDGPEKQALQEYIEANNLTKQVKMLGRVSEHKKQEYLASAQVAVYPSIGGESFGIVLIEAMAAGCVTLAGNNPGYSYVMKKCPDAIFDPLSYEKMAHLIHKCLTDKNLITNLRSQQSYVISEFTVETVGPQILDQYRYAIEKIKLKAHN